MVVTCPNCKRRFNLPLNLVRSRNAKLKCSKCKATFTQDLRELIGVPSAKLTDAEERFIASLPAAAPPAAPPGGPRPAPAVRPPGATGPAPVRSASDTAKQPVFSPTAVVGEARPDFDEHAPTKQMPVVTSRQATKKTPSIPPVAPPAPPAAPPIATPRAPAAPQPAPVAAPHAPPAPPRAPGPVAPPPERVIDGYESFGEQPAMDAEHEEALARAEAAHAELETARRAAEQAEAEARERAAAAARAAEEAARAQAAVDAALDEAMRAAAAEQARAAAQEADAQRRRAEHAALDARLARESYIDQERALAEPEAAARPAGFDGPPVEGADVPIDVPLDEGPATPPPPAPAPVTDPHQRAIEMFGGVTTSGRIVLTAMVDVDDVLELSDEEATGPWRWVGLGTGIVLFLALAFFLFVLGRNGWRLDLPNFATQVKYAFGVGGPVQDDRTCLAASVRLPALVRGQDGVMVIVRGTINNFCERSVSGAAIVCTLEGPGGPWTDTARPFSSAGASDLTEDELKDRTTGAMASEIGRRENSAGVVLPGATHEFWCTFPSAAGPDSHASRFRPSFEVTVP